MGKVEKIEREICVLSLQELAVFRKWCREFDADAWDGDIEADARAGRLNAGAEAALKAHRAAGRRLFEALR